MAQLASMAGRPLWGHLADLWGHPARLLGLTPRQIGYALRKHDIEMKKL